MGKQRGDKFSDKEAQRRFMVALKAAVNTPPKPKTSRGKRAAKKRA
jgi:hypothetical protein